MRAPLPYLRWQCKHEINAPSTVLLERADLSRQNTAGVYGKHIHSRSAAASGGRRRLGFIGTETRSACNVATAAGPGRPERAQRDWQHKLCWHVCSSPGATASSPPGESLPGTEVGTLEGGRGHHTDTESRQRKDRMMLCIATDSTLTSLGRQGDMVAAWCDPCACTLVATAVPCYLRCHAAMPCCDASTFRERAMATAQVWQGPRVVGLFGYSGFCLHSVSQHHHVRM